MNSRRGFLQTIAAAISGRKVTIAARVPRSMVAYAYRDAGHTFYRLKKDWTYTTGKIGDTITLRKPARFR